jgi:hypothetical protein
MTATPEFTPPLPDAELFDIREWPIAYARLTPCWTSVGAS